MGQGGQSRCELVQRVPDAVRDDLLRELAGVDGDERGSLYLRGYRDGLLVAAAVCGIQVPAPGPVAVSGAGGVG